MGSNLLKIQRHCQNPNEKPIIKKLADAIFEDDDWKQFLTTRFSNALDIALSRVAWNYKNSYSSILCQRS